jgi:hypothetical protein
MTPTDHVYIVTTIDSDGDTWVLHVCATQDAAQYARVKHANQLVLDGYYTGIDEAIDGRHIRIEFHKIEDLTAVSKSYSPK